MSCFIYEYPQTGGDYTAASHLFVSPCDRPLTGIYGTPVIFYIYPLRLLPSRLIIIFMWRRPALSPLELPLCCCLREKLLDIAIAKRGMSMTKIIIFFNKRKNMLLKYSSWWCSVIYHEWVCVWGWFMFCLVVATCSTSNHLLTTGGLKKCKLMNIPILWKLSDNAVVFHKLSTKSNKICVCEILF